MFVFEDLVFVDDRGIQSLLKEVDQQKLVIALKTAPEEIRAKLFKNMSNRAAGLLQEDLDALGPTKLSDVEKAQSEIVQKCKELELSLVVTIRVADPPTFLHHNTQESPS